MATKKKSAKKSGSSMSTAEKVEIGAGLLAAAAAAGATGYYFYGTAKAKKHRHAASSWARGLKNEVVRQAKTLKKVDAKTVAAVVEQAAASYRGARGVADGDLRAAALELKKNWAQLQKELAPAKKKSVKKAAKPKAKKSVKKIAKKSVKKVKTKKTAKK